jgi:hypothetical protein
MRRIIGVFLLVPALALLSAPAKAQFVADPLVGTYMNESNGGTCTVAPAAGGYLFTNENGDQALFAYAAPQRLAITNTLFWDPNVVATVFRGRSGRLSIRFTSPSAAPGFWVQVG